MKALFLRILTCFLVFILALVPASGQEEHSAPGQLHRIEIGTDHAKPYRPRVGDLIQCFIDFPVVPERLIEDLRITIEGKSTALVTVVYTSKRGIVGSGQISAFMSARQPGVSKVSIRPITNGKRRRAVLLTFLVQPPRQR